MPQSRRQKKAKQKKAKQNLDFRVIPRNKDTWVRRSEPDAEEWQQEDVHPKRVRRRSEKGVNSVDGLFETMKKKFNEEMETLMDRFDRKISDSIAKFKKELRKEVDMCNARTFMCIDARSDEHNAFRALHARILLHRSRQTAAEALGLSKWEEIREKGNAHAQVTFFKSAALALPDSSPKKDMLLTIANNPSELDILLNRSNTLRTDYLVHHAE
ncbi:hypothetical protein BD410DRAFT_896160 [Rickenella mellea]|uniref:Uncharacterized protein n=1 Tax=Rickenella mellea TaxID=50990 RepID=A0A4Y7QDR0_9AGAM|nr:hypothetical protein BD410DRAFT_896160 [Rickenella mellea]